MAFFNFNGSQLSYQTFGNPSNPALLLLHGNNGSQHDFKRHVTYLVPDFYVITQEIGRASCRERVYVLV